jgi:hypothetical protein
MDQQGAIDQERNFSVSNLTGLHWGRFESHNKW